MLGALVFLVLGLAALTWGGDLLVAGASDLALRLRVPATVIGLTIVAAGTSMPELVVSIDAAARGASDLSIGNVVGSNLYNILLILGGCALMRPLRLEEGTLRVDAALLVGSAGLLLLLMQDGRIGRIDGMIFVVGYLSWLGRMLLGSSAPATDDEVGPDVASRARASLRIAMGFALLVGGARLVVSGAVTLAGFAGLSERVIGLTIVAMGTSLPEAFASLSATARGEDGLAVTNVVGSNIFNILFILGVTALIRPMPVDPSTISSDMPLVVVASLLLVPLLWTGRALGRLEGATFVGLASGYTAWLVTA